MFADLVGRAAWVLSLTRDGLIVNPVEELADVLSRRSCSTGMPPPHLSHFLMVERYSLRVARDRALRANNSPLPS